MDNSTLIWIIVAAVVVIALVAFVVMRSRGGDAQRHKAEQIRREAAEHEREVRLREAEAAKTDAQARKAAAEADEEAAHAARLSAEADEKAARARELAEDARTRTEEAHGVRSEHDERLREADRLDPDVDTDKRGVRTDGTTPGATTSAAGGAGAAMAGSHDRRDEWVRDDHDHDGSPDAEDPKDGPVDRDGDGIDDREEEYWDRQTRERDEQTP